MAVLFHVLLPALPGLHRTCHRPRFPEFLTSHVGKTEASIGALVGHEAAGIPNHLPGTALPTCLTVREMLVAQPDQIIIMETEGREE